MENSGGIRASLAGRYATALFGLAQDQKQVESVSQGLENLEAAMRESNDFKTLVTSPLVGRKEAGKAVRALTSELGLDPTTANFLAVLADNGRLGELGNIIRLFRKLAAEGRGETTAEVTSARPLADDQIAALKSNLKKRVGQEVTIESKVDPELLGGIVVRLGSQMIDASIRTKLNSLAHAMKG